MIEWLFCLCFFLFSTIVTLLLTLTPIGTRTCPQSLRLTPRTRQIYEDQNSEIDLKAYKKHQTSILGIQRAIQPISVEEAKHKEKLKWDYGCNHEQGTAK